MDKRRENAALDINMAVLPAYDFHPERDAASPLTNPTQSAMPY
jgi:hypothetical protein